MLSNNLYDLFHQAQTISFLQFYCAFLWTISHIVYSSLSPNSYSPPFPFSLLSFSLDRLLSFHLPNFFCHSPSISLHVFHSCICDFVEMFVLCLSMFASFLKIFFLILSLSLSFFLLSLSFFLFVTFL